MDLRAENEDLRRRLAEMEAALREAGELRTAAVESAQARLNAAEIELAQAEAAVRDSEERLRRVLDGMGEGFGLLAPDFTVLEHNREALRMDGRGRDEIVGRSHWEAFPGSEQTELGRRLKQAMAERIPVTLEHRYAWEKDRALWLEMRAYPTADGGLAVFWRDVTDRVEAVDAVRESEARFAQFAASTTDVLWIRDADTMTLEYISPAFESVFGVTTSSVEGGIEPGVALVETADRERVMEHLNAARQGEPQVYEFRILHGSDGGARWILDHCFPLLDGTGRVQRIGGIARDVTALKLADEALRASEARLAAAFESVPVGLAVVDAAGKVVLANDMYRRFLSSDVIPSRDPEHRRRWRGWDADGKLLAPENWPSARGLRGESVAPGQEMLFTTDEDREVWTRVSVAPIRDSDGKVTGAASVIADIDAEKRSAELLRESEKRQAFLLKLSDATRVLDDPVEIQTVALRLLAEHMGLSRAAYSEIDEDEDRACRVATYDRDLPPVPRNVRISDFSADQLACYLEGRTFVVSDTETDERVAATREACRAIQVRAWVGAPILKGGRLLSVLGVEKMTPHVWTDDEIALVQEVTERTWAAAERGYVEAALRKSEARFRQFSAASAAALWIRDAETLDMEFTSRAIGDIYGVEPQTLLGDVKRWAAMIVPEDRDSALAHLEDARRGATAVHEFRIQRPSDGAFRWIRNTDFPLEDAAGRVERIGGIAEDVTQAKLAVEHQGVLLAELQHRVRNIMAMIRSMSLRTGDGASDVDDYRSLLEGRLLALARVQVLLTREANAGGSLRDIITSEVAAQAHREDQFELEGPEIRLSPKAVEVLTLAFHELATNALKYGALSVPDGRLCVSWKTFEKRGRTWLALDWTETGVPMRGPSKRRGFGSDLIEGRIPYELGGMGKLTLEPQGAHCRMEFPLEDGESILETDAPMPTTIFGGALDMSDAPDLTGRRVLIVEDDYYIAGDTAAALRGAGAEVLGPCPNEDATLDLLDSQTPTHAVLDLNLGGGGPKFEIARVLKERGVPFLFMTGYDPDVIPAELEDVPRLQKPIPFRKLIEVVSQL